MPYDLQQYARSRLPGTATAKPTEPRNVTAEQPRGGATQATTYGFANALRMCVPAWVSDACLAACVLQKRSRRLHKVLHDTYVPVPCVLMSS